MSPLPTRRPVQSTSVARLHGVRTIISIVTRLITSEASDRRQVPLGSASTASLEITLPLLLSLDVIVVIVVESRWSIAAAAAAAHRIPLWSVTTGAHGRIVRCIASVCCALIPQVRRWTECFFDGEWFVG